MTNLFRVVKITCVKSNISKTINLDEYTPYKARHIFDFYANHSAFLIELV
mgnify:CR=1 FL=1